MTFGEKQVQKLAELEKTLTRDNWEWLHRNIKLDCPLLDTIDTPTLRQQFKRGSGVDDSELIRTYLWQSLISILIGTVEPIGGNVRSLWYQRLKPFYRRHQLLITDLEVDPLLPAEFRKRYATRADRIADTMCLLLAEVVMHRVFRYADMGFTAPLAVRARAGRGRPRSFLVTEKEGLWGTVQLFYTGKIKPDQPAAAGPDKKPVIITFPSISAFASNGQPSLLALESFEPTLKKKTKSLRVGALVDYNPYGYQIALAYTDKLTFLGFDVRTYLLSRADWFTPEQVADGEDYSHCPTQGEQTLADEWFALTGGINGQKIGVDVDVVSKAKLMMHCYAWIQALEKSDGEDPPGYPVLTPEDAVRVSLKLGGRRKLLADEAIIPRR